MLQKRVIPTLHYALAPGGYLVLGASETVGSHSDLFDVVDKKQHIYRARGRRPRPPADLWPAQIGGTAPAVERPPRAKTSARGEKPFDIDSAADAVVLANYTSPAVVVNERLEIIRFRGQTEPYLRHVSGKATFDLLTMVVEDLAVHVGAAIGEARRSGAPVTLRDLPLRRDERDELLHVHVAPIAAPADELYFVVLFESVQTAPASGAKARATRATRSQPRWWSASSRRPATTCRR